MLDSGCGTESRKPTRLSIQYPVSSVQNLPCVHPSTHPSIHLPFVLLLSLVFGTALAGADRLVLLDGTAASDTVTGIDAEGLVHRQPGRGAVNLQGLRRIERPIKPDAPKPAACDVHLVAGGVLRAEGISFDAERFTVHWAYGGKLALPLSAVRALRMGKLPDAKTDATPAPFAASLGGQPKRDELFAIIDKKIHVVRGGLQQITSKEVLFHWNDAERKVAREKVYGLVLAHHGPKPDRMGQCLIRLKDGSSLWAPVTKLEGGKLHVRLGGEIDLSLPWDAVCRLDVRSTRMAFLSDLDPVEVVEEALVTYAGPWRRDRNVVGGPLTLGKTVYEKGLGVHARCRLTYDLDGRYDVFAAVIGLDATASGRGDCVFVVEADGKELMRKRMRGDDRSVPVRLKLAKAQRLTLLVDWGEDLDLADRANWCDARVLKQGDGK